MCFSFLTSCQYLADRKDKIAIRKQCRIPEYASLVDFKGTPWMSGFGQREGLHVSALFLIEESKRKEFETNSKSIGWEPLPIPKEVRDKIRPGRSRLNLDAQSGLFRCHYAGDNVLYAEETQPCYYTTSGRTVSGKIHPELNDMILSIYNPLTGEVTAEVFSSY